MNDKIREFIVYIVFGVLTTLVNIVVYELSNAVLGEGLYLVSNIIAWIIAVAFAYITNKIWVFKSRSWKKRFIIKEMTAFVSARLFTLLLEEAGLWLMIDVIGMSALKFILAGYTLTGNTIAKLIMQVVVVVANYVLSKLIIFKKKGE